MHFDARVRLGILAVLLSVGCSDGGAGASSGGTGGTNAVGTTTGGVGTSTAPISGTGGVTLAGTTASPLAGGAGGVGGTANTGGSSSSTTLTCGTDSLEEGFVEVKASDPGIRYVGRLDFTNPDGPKMAFPAVTIESLFEGDAIDLRLTELAPGGATRTAYYDVSIDSGPPTKLMTCPQRTVYPLARNLSTGQHRIRISKRTEAQVGTATFLGFRVRTGTSLSLPTAPTRRLEFVGDSITCGYGNEVSTTDPASYTFTSANENALLSYGGVTATALDADYVVVAASGRGMFRNYGGATGLTIPKFYDLTAPDTAWSTWDFARYAPDVIVVNLGTNDFSTGLTTDELVTMREGYRLAYTEFLKHLRAVQPLATLIGAVGPMMSDGYPTGYQAWTSVRADVKSVIDTLTSGGDSNVFYLEFTPQSSPYGEDWHPTLATHQRMATQLATFIKQTKSW